MATKSFPPGVYAPSLTWFSDDKDQAIDWELQSKHLTYLISSGLTGSRTSQTTHDVKGELLCWPWLLVVIAGSNGEAVATSLEERLKLISLTRELAISQGQKDMIIVIGTVGQTTKDIISQLHQAKDAGADFALVLTPSYFHFAMNTTAIQDFFIEVWWSLRAVSYHYILLSLNL